MRALIFEKIQIGKPIDTMTHIRKDNKKTLFQHKVRDTRRRLLADVVFGMPGRDCLGSGVCMVALRDQVRVRWKCPHSPVWLSRSDRGGLRMEFEKSDIPEAFVRRYFQGNLFRVDENYSLPLLLAEAVSTDFSKIYSGVYPVNEDQ